MRKKIIMVLILIEYKINKNISFYHCNNYNKKVILLNNRTNNINNDNNSLSIKIVNPEKENYEFDRKMNILIKIYYLLKEIQNKDVKININDKINFLELINY